MSDSLSDPPLTPDSERKGLWTPGPWRVCRDGKCSCRQVWHPDAPVFTARPDACVNIGTAHQQWGDGPEMIYGEIPEHETQANAHLIAAAPDLYEALEACLTPGMPDHLVIQAWKALAKARGESSVPTTENAGDEAKRSTGLPKKEQDDHA